VTNNVNVTNRGFEYLCRYMTSANNNGANNGYTIPSYIGWGGANGYNTVATVLPGSAATTTNGTGQWMDVAPYQEFAEARVLSSSTSVTGAVVGGGTITSQFVGTITAGSGETVAESFLAFGVTKPVAFTLSGNQTSAVATSLTVTTSGAPTSQYYQFNNEVIYLVSTAASNVWTITRGQNGSTAGTAATGNIITLGNIPGAGGSNPNNGDLFAHAGFIGLALNNGDSIQFTWQINVTS
jgi:hypothetical protein